MSTISTVSSAVTRMPPTKRGSLPRRFMRAPIWGPPPCTMTGLMPTRRRRMTSRAKDSLRSACSMAAPPYLMTTVLPRNSRMYGRASRRTSARRTSPLAGWASLTRYPSSDERPSQDVPREILIAGDVAQPRLDIGGVHRQILAGHVGRRERDVLEELFHDRVESAGSDVLGARVDPHGHVGDRLHRIRREGQGH